MRVPGILQGRRVTVSDRLLLAETCRQLVGPFKTFYAVWLKLLRRVRAS